MKVFEQFTSSDEYKSDRSNRVTSCCNAITSECSLLRFRDSFVCFIIWQRLESQTGKANCYFDPFSEEEEGELEAEEVEMDVDIPTDVSGG